MKQSVFISKDLKPKSVISYAIRYCYVGFVTSFIKRTFDDIWLIAENTFQQKNNNISNVWNDPLIP